MDWRREFRLYLIAQQFLTRLPTPGAAHEPGALSAASRYFPAVGLLLGLLAGLVWLPASALFPPAVAAGLTIGALLLATGALHEDGLADCCDGLGGGATPERALEIMRDSRIGVYAAAGLIVVIGLRWGALADMPTWRGLAALMTALAAGRAAMAAPMALLPYARPDGAARDAAAATPGDAMVAAAIALAAGLLLAGLAGLLAVALALLLGLVWARYLQRRLGGFTGDALGAAEQIGQTAALIALAA